MIGKQEIGISFLDFYPTINAVVRLCQDTLRNGGSKKVITGSCPQEKWDKASNQPEPNLFSFCAGKESNHLSHSCQPTFRANENQKPGKNLILFWLDFIRRKDENCQQEHVQTRLKARIAVCDGSEFGDPGKNEQNRDEFREEVGLRVGIKNFFQTNDSRCRQKQSVHKRNPIYPLLSGNEQPNSIPVGVE